MYTTICHGLGDANSMSLKRYTAVGEQRVIMFKRGVSSRKDEVTMSDPIQSAGSDRKQTRRRRENRKNRGLT